MTMEAIIEFLGFSPIEQGPKDIGVTINWEFSGEKLKYCLALNPRTKNLGVSADPEHPFGFQSLVEIVVPFDRMAIETEQMFYGDRPILVLRKDYPDAPDFKTLMLIRWDNGDLSIWPNNFEAHQAELNDWPTKN